MTSMTPPQPKQARLEDVWPWNPPRTSTLTICEVPADLLTEFFEVVVNPNYPKGIVPAILDLMENAVAAQKTKRCSAES